MKSILITGISGFVGGHFTRFLLDKKTGYDIHGLSRTVPAWNFFPGSESMLNAITLHQCDLLNTAQLENIIEQLQPDFILHLASLSSVAESWRAPRTAFLNNTTIFLNIAETVRKSELHTRILSVGSSEEYGIIDPHDLPITEKRDLSPKNPYAVARVSEENLALVYVKGYNLDICCTRSFNHIGTGQSDQFVVSSIARQFAEITVNHTPSVIKIGNGAIIRDFIDIDDVVCAYDALLTGGISGEVYNVCSGTGHSIRDIVHSLSNLTGIPVTITEDCNRIRLVDNPALIGTYDKLQKTTGWTPKIPLETSLEKIYQFWLNQLS